jgi:hypothetical protein
VGLAHDDRRDGIAKQCLAVVETKTAAKGIGGESVPKEKNQIIFYYLIFRTKQFDFEASLGS